MENRFLNQLISTRTGVDNLSEVLPESTNAVVKLLRDKLILVFHNHVLKHPEECKTLGKFAAPLVSKLINRAVKKLLL